MPVARAKTRMADATTFIEILDGHHNLPSTMIWRSPGLMAAAVSVAILLSMGVFFIAHQLDKGIPKAEVVTIKGYANFYLNTDGALLDDPNTEGTLCQLRPDGWVGGDSAYPMYLPPDNRPYDGAPTGEDWENLEKKVMRSGAYSTLVPAVRYKAYFIYTNISLGVPEFRMPQLSFWYKK